MERVHDGVPMPSGRRLLVRLCLLAFCGGLLVLLSSRPADAGERREPRLLDPVGTTLKATAREVDSFAGRATGSGSSTVGTAAEAARQAVAPRSRPASRAARSSAATTVKRGAPAVTSPVRRVAPPTRPVLSATRTAARSVGTAAEPVTGTLTGPLERAGKLAAKPTGPAAKIASVPLGRVAGVAGSLAGPVLNPVGSVLSSVGPILGPVGFALAPVGSALDPLGSALGPLTSTVGGLVPGLGGLVGVGPVGPGGPAGQRSGLAGTGSAGFASATAVQTTPARLAPGGAGSHAARPFRSWPALTGAVSLPGVPASAELPAGGPDPLSTSSGAGLGPAALAGALLVLGLLGRGRARPERSGILSRSYLPLVSPA